MSVLEMARKAEEALARGDEAAARAWVNMAELKAPRERLDRRCSR